MPEIPILLLAAGKSSRIGKPKQLLPWGKSTLFEHAMATALTFKRHPLFVVVGAYHEQLLPLIPPQGVEIVINSQWKEGMGNSIAVGLNAILKSCPKASGVLILLADQPLIDNIYLTQFLNQVAINKKQIIASSYPDGSLGVPAFFDAFYFKEILGFSRDQGAQKLMAKYAQHISRIPGKKLLADVDTEEAYRELLSQLSLNPQS